MDRFIVQADAIYTGKLVDQLWRRLCTLLAHDCGANRIEFGGSNTGAHGTLHGFQHAAHDSAGGAHSGKVFGTVDGHASSLSHSWDGATRNKSLTAEHAENAEKNEEMLFSAI